MTGKWAAVGFVLALAAGLAVSTGTTEAMPPGGPDGSEYRLQITAEFTPNGMRVLSVDPNGPAASLTRVVNGQRYKGILDTGDVILAVDGMAIHTQDDYHAAMRASHNGRVRLTVRDVKTGQVAHWYAQAVLVPVGSNPGPGPGPGPNPGPGPGPQQAGRASAVTVLIVADTDDASIGSYIRTSLNRLQREVSTIPGLPAGRIRVKVLSGSRVDAKTIMTEVNALQVGPTETVLYYHLGHGAFDESRASGDPVSGGHFFQLTGGDLMRKTVWDSLRKKGAQLTVMVTDTCNVPAPASPLYAAPSEKLADEAPKAAPRSVIGSLLLDHAGEINVSGSSRNQYGWYSPDLGGWFTDGFCYGLTTSYPGNGVVTWDAFLRVAGKKTSDTYRNNRGSLLASANLDTDTRNLLQKQTDQQPQVFVRNVHTVR
jgi:hypothetical protein